MKVKETTKPINQFTPKTIEITFETQEEINVLMKAVRKPSLNPISKLFNWLWDNEVPEE
jgi:hypothetical protein